MENKIFDELFKNSLLKNIDLEAEKAKILADPNVKAIIEKLNLNSKQIQKGMNYLQKYYSYIETHKQLPTWTLFVDDNGILQIDLSNDGFFRKQKEMNNFWLTNITSMDNEWIYYFNNAKAKKPQYIVLNTNQSLEKFAPELKNEIKDITSMKSNQGLLLIDQNLVNARNILKFLAFLFGTKKSKSVAFVDNNNLFEVMSNNLKNSSEINSIVQNLISVDYLFIDRFAIGVKPEWYITNIFNILSEREQKNKITFMSSPIDFTSSKQHIIFNKMPGNDGITRIESLLKLTVLRLMKKFISF